MNPHELGALILELAEANRPVVRVQLRRWRMWPSVSGLDDIVEGVLSDLIATLWDTRDRWVEFPPEDQRRWACGIAKNITRNRAGRMSKHVWSEQATTWTDDGREFERPEGDDAPVHLRSHQWNRELLDLQVIVERELGVQAWQRISTRALHKHATNVRACLVTALTDLRAGRPVDLAPLVRRCSPSWRGWALARMTFGEPLNVDRAVRLGLFHGEVHATGALATWWAEQRLTAGLSIDTEAIKASGLVDHFDNTEASEIAAESIAERLHEAYAPELGREAA